MENSKENLHIGVRVWNVKKDYISKKKSGVASSESKVQRLCYNLLARHDYNDITQSSPI